MTDHGTELSKLKVIFTAEVQKHHYKENGVWMIIHNNVYDVTSFLEEHPGGEDSLLDVAGKEATQDFEDVGHSDDARELMKKYLIGTLPPEEHKKTGGTTGEKDKFEPPCSNLKWAVFALAGALVFGIVLKKYLSK
ncbi:cytochrome b5-like [Pararge aegeria]|uniref:cytochrome b5-like n=1 Tax=Pararge aegeria TaxID=116150 RepID=UPI0019D12A28|nr:cytochrome b5-like [Pararge aegeria]